MQFWKFMELFEHHKYYHNMQIKRMIYVIETEKEEKKQQVVYF